MAAGVWFGQKLLDLGIARCAGTQITPAPHLLLIPLGVLAILMFLLRRRSWVLIPGIVLILALVGMGRVWTHPFEPCFGPDALVQYHDETPYGRPQVLEGVIVGYPVQREKYVQYQVRVDAIWQGGDRRPIHGMALVRADTDSDMHYGDAIRIRGVPTTPPSFPGFDYRRFLARKGIYTLIRRADVHLLAHHKGNAFFSRLYAVRARASAILNQLMPQPYAALANGMILGIESGIPRELYEQFNLTGASHVIVISGSNIAIVSGLLLMLFSFVLGRRRTLAALLSITGIILYTLLVGADAAVVRAAIMGGLYVLAIAFNRQSIALITLFVAGLIMLLLNPLTLWDVGFQLSFMATLGLILFSTPLQTRWNAVIGKRLPGPVNSVLAEGLLITLAAQLTTMPLVVIYFGRLSLISFLANLLILPVQPPIMIVGGVSILLGMVFLPLAQLIAMIPLASLWWTVFVVQRTAAIPWGSIEVNAFGRMVASLYYAGFLAGFVAWVVRRERGAAGLIPETLRPGVTRALLAAGLLVLPLWMGAAVQEARPDGRLHIRLLGMNHAVAWLLTAPGGQRVLLVGNESDDFPLPDILKTLPNGKKPLNLTIFTLPEANFDPKKPILAQKSLLSSDLAPEMRIRLDEDVTLRVMPTPAAEPLLFHLSYGDFSLLLPLTNSQQTQQTLAADPATPAVTVLVTPWPGTGAWPNPDLITVLHPQQILQPRGVTYPPGVQQALAAQPGLTAIPNDAITEIIIDGRSYWLQQQPYAADSLHR